MWFFGKKNTDIYMPAHVSRSINSNIQEKFVSIQDVVSHRRTFYSIVAEDSGPKGSAIQRLEFRRPAILQMSAV